MSEQLLLDDEWAVYIQDEIDAQPDIALPVETLADIYHLGCTDRDLGIPSHSLEYADRDERAAYVAGRCATKRVLSIAEMRRELEALQDAMDDENFWRIGAW